jgi:hypothetical protein
MTADSLGSVGCTSLKHSFVSQEQDPSFPQEVAEVQPHLLGSGPGAAYMCRVGGLLLWFLKTGDPGC